MPANTATVQTEVSFTGTSQNASNYSWDFGDGTIVTGITNPTHTYTTPGTYVITLTVTNASGCSSSTTQTLTVAAIATGLNNVSDNNISMWSNADHVYVDFTQAGKVDAVVRIFDILGQELSKDKFTSNTVYQKTIDQIDAAYVIVNVKNGDKVTTRKLFIVNTQQRTVTRNNSKIKTGFQEIETLFLFTQCWPVINLILRGKRFDVIHIYFFRLMKVHFISV